MSRQSLRPAYLSLILTGLLLAVCPHAGRAADVTWTNAAGGSWGEASNWSGGAVPGAGDVVHITLDGTYVVDASYQSVNSISIGGLELGGTNGTQKLYIHDPNAGARLPVPFTIGGAASVNEHGAMEIVNIKIEGAGGFALAGALTVHYLNELSKDLTTATTSHVTLDAVQGQPVGGTGPAVLTVSQGFTNLGIIELTSHGETSGFPDALIITSGTLVNAPSGSIVCQAGLLGTWSSRTLRAELDNQGVVTANTLLELSPDYAAANVNSGTINVTGGDFAVLHKTGTISSFTNTGAITVSAGQTLRVNQGTLNQNGGSISGAGRLRLEGGVSAYWNTPFQLATLDMYAASITLTSDLLTASTELTMYSAGLSGAVTVTNAPGHTVSVANSTIDAAFTNQGTLLTENSSFNGAFSNAAGALVRLTGAGGVTMASGFTNLGRIELGTANSSLVVTSGTLVNEVGAVISCQPPYGGALPMGFDNRGTVTVGANLSMGRNGAVNANSGEIAVTGGDLSINQFGAITTNTGAITVSSGRTLRIRGGGLTQSGGSISGAGTLWLEYAGTQFNTPVGVANLQLGPSGTAILSSDLSTANTSLQLLHSTLGGPVTVTNAGQITTTFEGSNNINTALVNEGTLIASGNINGAFTTTLGSTLQVPPSGNLTVANGFTNAGGIEMSRGTMTVTDGTLINAGSFTTTYLSGDMATLNAQIDNQGQMTIGGPFTLDRAAGHHLNNGTINVGGADFRNLQGSGSFTNNGTITVAAGQKFWSEQGTFLNAATGQLKGMGTYEFANTLTNEGTISPGASPGILSISGGVTFSGGTLDIELGGLTAGTEYDRLAASGAATLDGKLRVTLLPGFCAGPGDAFRVLDAASRAGTFASVEILGTGNPQFDAQYDATGLTLVTQSNNLTVSASAGPGGSISPSGAVVASCGTNPSFTMTPNAGFEVANVVVDGNSVGAKTSYTFSDISDDHTIAATFVDVAAPAVHVITPNGGEVVHADHVTKIRWTAVDNVAVDSVHVEYSLNGAGGPWTTILRSGTPTDSVAWAPPNQCSDNALIRVTSKDPTHNAGTDVSDGAFRVACGAADVGASRMGLALRVPNPVGLGPIHMRISLPAAGTATVEVIAVTGQKVWSSRLEGYAGTHNVTWNGRNAEPGVYFARLVTAYGNREVRFVVLR